MCIFASLKVELKIQMSYKMKKLVSSLLVGAMVFAFANVQARNVSEQEARQAAANYFTINTDREVSSADLTLVHQIDNMKLSVAECYMYNVTNGGWLIMAGSAAATPVIAYSENDWLEERYSDLPANMRWFLESYLEIVEDIQIADATENYSDLQEWHDLLLKSNANAPKAQTVNLVNLAWDQGDADRPSYNLYCPRINGKYCPTGCVATALAQIVCYWGSPIQPRHSKSYQWSGGVTLGLNYDTIQFDYSLMPSRLTDRNYPYGIIATDEEVREVAKLNYAIGIAVEMDYAVDGSAAYSTVVPNRMKYYFRYNPNAANLERAAMGASNFIARLRNNLINRIPVYMSGASSTGTDGHAAGHAWICTGYKVDENNADNEKKYYMNWGWNGSGNGWYDLVGNNMNISSMGYNFNVRQGAIFGLYPASADSTNVDFLGIPEVADNVVLHPAFPNPANLTVSLPYNITSPAEMTIYSIDGKVVETRSLKPGSGAVNLNVSNMPAGIYIYRIGDKSGKFMVQ